MPTPPLNEVAKREAVRAVEEFGSISAAAKALGVARSTLQHRLKLAELDETTGPGVQEAFDRLGIDGAIVRGGWLKDKGASIRFDMPSISDDMIERIKAAFIDVVPAEPATAPAVVMDDLCTLYPLMDLHLGMHAWGQETGGPDYDLKLACQDLRYAFAKVWALTPASKEAVLILGGDTLHADDDRAETPISKHKLDVDGRQHKVIEAAIAILSEIIDRLLEKHERVTVRTLRGNHDTHSHMVLTFALSERYRNEPRIAVDRDPRDLFMKQWGKSAIFAHHGDKAKPERMALYISDVCPFWSETRHRHYFVGHVHHDHAKDIGPLRYESLRAFCPPDAYAASMGYGGRRALQAVTFHAQDGIVLRAIDPIERGNSA